jgi:YibE/F-like protein
VTDRPFAGGTTVDPDDVDPDEDDGYLAALARTRPRHHHRAVPRSPRALRAGLAVLVPCALVTALALIWLWPRGAGSGQAADKGQRQLHGVVSSVEHLPCPPPAEGAQPPPAGAAACGAVLVRLSDGPDAGKLVATDIPFGPGAPTVRRGDRVVLLYIPDAAADQKYQILDQQRGFQLWMLVAAFAIAVIAFGRWRGLTALAGLAVTFAVLLLFIVPAILAGR